jgi:molybdopterin/thiamine biosynthesis adenylyltransferase
MLKAMDVEKLIKEEFSRNIGLLSEDEQRKLLKARVAVAGAGGVGGIQALTLARLGIGNFNIADPDTFEAVNLSRQFGATINTIGRNKAMVLSEMVREINPHADVRVFSEGINNENVALFLDSVNVYIDGIDFFEIDTRRLIFKKARELGIHALTSAPLGFGATLQVFSPAGMTFDEYFGISDSIGEGSGL